MKIFRKTVLVSSTKVLLLPLALCISFDSAYASLTSITQNQPFESKPTSSSFRKLASVYFITGNDAITFDEQEFKTDDVCASAGYTFRSCPSGYIAVDPCPDDGSYYKNCIDKSTWCQNNGYNITSCQLPTYPMTQCPYNSNYYKTCETDNIKACKELGYSLTCETGKVGDTGDVCPYNSSYNKCICNPCNGYDYTASEATEQGYTMGESCNSCGTLKYKRTANVCEGYLECDAGGATGADVCYSGSVKKFSECLDECASQGYIYTKDDCTGDYVVDTSTGYCFGKYKGCVKGARILYGDGTVGMISEIYQNKDKIPVGFVLDEEKRLAVSLTNITQTGTMDDKLVPFASGINESISLQRWDNYNLCQSSSGKENTKILVNPPLDSVMLPPFAAAVSANQFQPSGCTKSFCQKGKWFLPSPEESAILISKRDELSTTIAELYGRLVFTELEKVYGKLAEDSSYYKDAKLIEKISNDNKTPSYWLAQDEIQYVNGEWNFAARLYKPSWSMYAPLYSELGAVRPFVIY